MVVMKTGVTESASKMPVHLATTLRCVPHFAIFSDFEENFEAYDNGTFRRVRSVDCLRRLNATIRDTHPDFELYKRVREFGRAGLRREDFALPDEDSPFGKKDNPGWKLDKWKFLPMVEEALELRPEAKWYVFMEADSYIIWPNLIRWLSVLNATQPYYLGSQMQIGDVVFAYGGAGIILSHEAMVRVVKHRAQHETELNTYTDNHWAGDCVLGKALADAGVRFDWAWPIMQTSRVLEVNPFANGYGRRAWCHPIVSFHHMTTDDIQMIWQFEQQFFEQV